MLLFFAKKNQLLLVIFLEIYALSALRRVLIAFVDNITLQTRPSISTLTGCKLTFHLRRVALNECERAFPLNGPLPVNGHTLDIFKRPPLTSIRTLLC